VTLEDDNEKYDGNIKGEVNRVLAHHSRSLAFRMPQAVSYTPLTTLHFPHVQIGGRGSYLKQQRSQLQVQLLLYL
jgi:hypothetical protein